MKKNVYINSYSIVNSAGGSITIKENVTVGDFCNLYGQGGLIINKNCIIASHVMIIPNQHKYKDITCPIKDQGCKNLGIAIGENSWIGGNIVIMDGVNIGKHCVVGAGSIVNKSCGDYSVIVGNPVKIIKQYDKNCQDWKIVND